MSLEGPAGVRRNDSSAPALPLGRQRRAGAVIGARQLAPKCGCAVAAGRGTIRGVRPGLVTGRLVLRRVTAADVDNLLALDGDPEVMRYLEPRIKTRAQIEAEVLPLFLGRHQRYPGFGRWAAETRGGREFIGWFGNAASPAD